MTLYRKKPVEIEALQFDGSHTSAVGIIAWGASNDFAGMREERYSFSHDTFVLKIKTLEGEMEAKPGDWIIKGVQGEFYPCKPSIFDATYEEVR